MQSVELPYLDPNIEYSDPISRYEKKLELLNIKHGNVGAHKEWANKNDHGKTSSVFKKHKKFKIGRMDVKEALN